MNESSVCYNCESRSENPSGVISCGHFTAFLRCCCCVPPPWGGKSLSITSPATTDSPARRPATRAEWADRCGPWRKPCGWPGRATRSCLVKNDAPYRESFSLTGSRHSGTSEQPFTIRGNGAILDGSAPAPAEKWEAYKGAIFRLRGRPTGYSQLFLERPAGGAGVRRAIGQEPAEIGAPAMVLARRAHLFLRRKEQTARRL